MLHKYNIRTFFCFLGLNPEQLQDVAVLSNDLVAAEIKPVLLHDVFKLQAEVMIRQVAPINSVRV